MINTIFDLGFNNGDDTSYYLHKGYNVVAIEADPILCNKGKERFKKEAQEGRFNIINRAFTSYESNLPIMFYIHPTRKDISTCDKNKIQYWDTEPIIIKVETINYLDLINEFGIPYYIKCDIEGFDHLLIETIFTFSKIHEPPKYISFELSRFDYFKIFSYLYVSGYTKFQLINQTALGMDGDYVFTKLSSGKFGEYLSGEWLNYDECLTRYMKYKELKGIDNVNLALGWIDIHAKI